MGKGHLIDNRWIDAGGQEMVSLNPATGDDFWRGRQAGLSEVNAAVAAARKAAESWGDIALNDRIHVLNRFAEQLKASRAELTEAICLEAGKPRWESGTEVDSMTGKIAASIEAYKERRGETTRDVSGASGAVRYRPFGVVAVLGPFNFPGHLPNGHIVPALLAGNTVVFKPSEMTPGVGEKMMEIWGASGLMPGVINMVQGGRETGAALVQHSDVDGVFFTGSYAAGKAIGSALAERPGKIVALEMGGNNPLIVHRVSDVDAAVIATVQSAFITAGQRCSCARRLIVPVGKEGDRFVDRLVEMMGRVRVGAYTEAPEPFMGPVISDAAAEKLLVAQDEMRMRGAKSIVEMKPAGARKAMLRPGLMDVTEQGNREDEEVFGPLLQLVRVKDFDAAIAEANGTKYGLAAGLLSDERELFELFYRKIRAGVVNWNRPLTGASGYLPFGGMKCSGNNRPSGYFAADYCSYPVASVEAGKLEMPAKLPPGIGM